MHIDEHRRVTLMMGANARVDLASDILPALAQIDGQAAEAVRWVLVQNEIATPNAFLLGDLLEECKRRWPQARILFNSAPVHPPEDLARECIWPACDVLVVNRGEAESLPLHSSSSSSSSVDDRLLAERVATLTGIPLVIVTMGEGGLQASLKGITLEMPSAHVDPSDVVDTTGAGDCLIGYFVARFCFIEGECGGCPSFSLREALGWAINAASLAIGRLGTSTAIPTTTPPAFFNET